jgi:flagellar motor protein MotB
VRVRGRDRHPQDPAEDEEEQRSQEPTAGEADVDPRALAEMLRSSQPAGRGAATVIARALARLQNGHGNAAVARVLAARRQAQASPRRAPGALLQRALIATGSDADFDRFRAIAEPASGFLLGRDAATSAVTAIGSTTDPATSPAFQSILTTIMDDPSQNAEVNFGTGQAGVVIGAFPTPPDLTGSLVQNIDIDDIDAVETGAPGHGVAFLAHEMQENFVAHAATPVAGVNQFAAAHEQGNIAQSAVIADLAGTGPRVAERVSPGAAAGVLNAVIDFETDFLVLEITQAPGTTDFQITNSRQASRVSVSDQTIDGYTTGSDTPPGGGAVGAAAADLLAHPQATAIVEGFTDDVGKPAVNDPLSLRRAEQVRTAIIAAGAGLVADNVHVAGRGATGFVAPNLIEADRRRNRRVRIRVEEPAP